MAKILLVEDDNNLREIYGERLLAEGYEIVAARDGEEALSVAITEKPDLIISDVMMPKISGFDMLDILRQTPETKDVKIIMMTALSQAEDKARADMLGANKYLVKSQVTLEDVARVVHDILEEPKPKEATEQPAEVTNQTPTEPTSQPIVAAPADDSASSQVQQSDDSTQTNNNDTVVTEDNTQITDTDTNKIQVTTADNQNQTSNEVTPEPATNNLNNPEIQQPAQQDSTQTSAEQTEQPQIEQSQAPVADTPQPQIEQTEQPQDAPNNPEQNNQEEPQTSVEQSLATEPAQEAVDQPTEDTQQPQAAQEPTAQQEQPQEANIQPQTLPVNPIAQNVTETPAQESPQTTPEQPVSNSGDAEPAADELTEVTNQIEDFIKNSVTPLSEHQEPLTQPPTDINDTNKQQEQAQEPQVEQSSQDNSLKNTAEEQSTASSIPESPLETTQNQENTQTNEDSKPQTTEDSEPAPEVIDATLPYQTNEPTAPNDPEAPQDNTIPPVIPVDSAEDSQNDETRNPEPASVRKKIISPMHGDGDLGTPDINKLYQEEMAKEAEENGLQNPVANSIVSASTNPISVGSGNAELPQLETIDASQIPGISTDGTAPVGIVTPTTTPEQPVQADTAAPEPHEDPNNPNNIAL